MKQNHFVSKIGLKSLSKYWLTEVRVPQKYAPYHKDFKRILSMIWSPFHVRQSPRLHDNHQAPYLTTRKSQWIHKLCTLSSRSEYKWIRGSRNRQSAVPRGNWTCTVETGPADSIRAKERRYHPSFRRLREFRRCSKVWPVSYRRGESVHWFS